MLLLSQQIIQQERLKKFSEAMDGAVHGEMAYIHTTIIIVPLMKYWGYMEEQLQYN